MKKLLAILFTCAVFSAGCGPLRAFIATVTPAPTPTALIDLLSDKTCNKPCILGITPGKTATDDVIAMVQHSKLLPDCREHDLRSQLGPRWVDCPSEYFSIVFDGGLVSWFKLTPARLTVAELLSRYGAPDTVDIFLTTRPDEPARTAFIMLFNQIQAEVILYDQDGRQYAVKPDVQVQGILFNSEQEQEKIKALIVHSWRGYGVYPY